MQYEERGTHCNCNETPHREVHFLSCTTEKSVKCGIHCQVAGSADLAAAYNEMRPDGKMLLQILAVSVCLARYMHGQFTENVPKS